MAYYGSWDGPSCTFRAVLNFRVTEYQDTRCYVQYRFYVETTGGSFKGTTIKTNWDESEKMYSNGTYADSGWVNYGWVTYGNSVSKSGKAYYTGNSGTNYSSTVSGKYTPSAPTWIPYAPESLEVNRSSDTKNTLSWDSNIVAARPYSSIKVERKTDGGSWSQIASISGSATSYSDMTTSANHNYQYRIRAYNSAGYSSYATCSTVLYNTPSAPTKITATRLAETTVSVTITNPAITATKLELQRSTDKSSWETVATISGSPVTETTDEPGGGTFYYRARNTRGSLASAWSPASDAVVTICAPAAPTLVAPASGMVVSKAQETVTFEHRHNPIDGSGQTAAQYRISTDDGATYTYYDIEGKAEKLALENTFAVNSKVTYGVRTKGVHADYGPWSSNRVFYVYQEPSVAFAQPSDGFTVEDMPIVVELQYSDASGSLVNAEVSLSDESKVVYSRNLGTDKIYEIHASEWLPDDGATYTASVSVRSSSTLTASATRSFAVSFDLPQPATLEITPDPETGHVSIVTGYADITAELGKAELGEMELGTDELGDYVEAVSINIYRVYEGNRVLLAEGLQEGSAVVDMYAPLNVDYVYEAVTFAESGAANTKIYPSHVKTSWSFLYFKDDIARGMWNPDWSWDIDPSVEYVRYVGAEHPSAYMDDFVEEVYSLSVQVSERDEAQAFRRMMMAHEPVVAKLWRGEVFHAVPSVNGKPKSGTVAYWGEVSVDLTRIAGDAL